jgi:hypothetical protein
MVSTTINMHYDTRTRIMRAALMRNTTQKEIILFLLQRLMRDVDKYRAGFWGVRYQVNIPKKGWHRYFVRFRREEYEYFTDLRKLCKRSVSFLVAIAAEEYLDEPIGQGEIKRYNYISFPGYSLARKAFDGIECWLRYWGPYTPPETVAALTELIRTTCHSHAYTIKR